MMLYNLQLTAYMNCDTATKILALISSYHIMKAFIVHLWLVKNFCLCTTTRNCSTLKISQRRKSTMKLTWHIVLYLRALTWCGNYSEKTSSFKNWCRCRSYEYSNKKSKISILKKKPFKQPRYMNLYKKVITNVANHNAWDTNYQFHCTISRMYVQII